MADGGDDRSNIFVYLGGAQEVPDDVTHVLIDRSVKIIPIRAFHERRYLVSVETHDGIEKIEEQAFEGCTSLRRIKLPGVRVIEVEAFFSCTSLTDVEFGDKLETIVDFAFSGCHSLQKIKIPSVRTIGERAFGNCSAMADVGLPAVERIGVGAFDDCGRLRRVAIPLKDNMFPFNTTWRRYDQFNDCENLTTVDLVGGIHKTISSLLLVSWRDEMNQEIDRINQVLPDTPPLEKTGVIRLRIRSVINRIKRYKAEHNRLLKEDMTQLELAVWKAKLDEVMAHSLEAQPAKKAKIDTESVRKERRITSGADIIIKNVLPFLQLFE